MNPTFQELIDNTPYVKSVTHDIEERGIFFCWPFKKVYKEAFVMPPTKECTYYWYNHAKRWFIPRLYNWKIFKNLPKWQEESDFAGVKVIEFCSPIYFKRESRKAIHLFNCHTIDSIEVYGYEPYKNYCSGAVEVEIAKFTLVDGTTYTIKNYGNFHYFYGHVVEEEFQVKPYSKVFDELTQAINKLNKTTRK